jgi:sigma-E factor negative regulatory protein RseB
MNERAMSPEQGAGKAWRVLATLLFCGLPLVGFAQPAPEAEATATAPELMAEPPEAGATTALDWLARIAAAGKQLDYSGTFTYQSGRRIETSRIVHRYLDGEESERLEVLDGSPREVVRKGAEVRCVLPAQRTVIVSKSSARASFPATLTQNYADIASNYDVRLGEAGRIAGVEAQKIVIAPRDNLRYGHVLWADKRRGLLLKSQMVDADGDAIEQFAFNEVKFENGIADDQLAAKTTPQPDWRVVDAGADDVTPTEDRWRLREPLPGFSLVRKSHQRSGGAMHMVFSDGLAAISIFIEAAEAGAEARGGFPGGGAVNAFERIVDGQRITVLGEVPPNAVKQAAETLEAVPK